MEGPLVPFPFSLICHRIVVLSSGKQLGSTLLILAMKRGVDVITMTVMTNVNLLTYGISSIIWNENANYNRFFFPFRLSLGFDAFECHFLAAS
jgi:hypothetical protein